MVALSMRAFRRRADYSILAYSIDPLPKEKGVVDGHQTCFFHGWDDDNVRYESFRFGKRTWLLQLALWLA